MKASVLCPLCDQEACLRNADQSGYQRSKTYAIFHCDHCNTAFANPLKTEESIYNHIYAKAREVPGYDRYYDYAEKVLEVDNPLDYLAEAEDVYWGIREHLRKKGSKSLKILEVGCGFGYLTYALAQAEHKIKGIDISKVAIDNAIKRYGEFFECVDVKEFAKREGPAYELIIFTEVIEHIEDIKSFMQAIDELLLPGGDIIITTPNRTPYPKEVLWETEPPPVHLYWLSEASMNKLATFYNHEVSFIDFSPLNQKEYEERGDYFRPLVSYKDYRPTRIPRLDEEGNVIQALSCTIPEAVLDPLTQDFLKQVNLPIQLQEENMACLESTFSSLSCQKAKLFLKKLTKCLGLYALAKKILHSWRASKQAKEEQLREEQAKIQKLKLFPTTRPTMCAIFTKPNRLVQFQKMWR